VHKSAHALAMLKIWSRATTSCGYTLAVTNRKHGRIFFNEITSDYRVARGEIMKSDKIALQALAKSKMYQ
jgi:hypothetical protein